MKDAIKDHLRVVEKLAESVDLLRRIAEAIADCFGAGGRLYVLGNGGSAADAQHIAAELIGRFKQDRHPLPAVALTTDTSTLTAVSNDLGSEQMFARQVDGLVTERDILWILSVSGTSPNVVAAVDAARRRKARIVAFTGRRGVALSERCDYCLVVDHAESDRVQEAHELAYHLVCERVERLCADLEDSTAARNPRTGEGA